MTITHDVINQVPPLQGHDVADSAALLEGVEREGAAWALDSLHEVGELAGRQETRELGRLVEAHPPVLHTHDRYGHRVDTVEYNPAWHSLMTTAVELGLHGAPWRDKRTGAHVARAAKLFVWTQVDAGHTCPISMT